MEEKNNFITGSLIRETYDSNKLVDRKMIPECILILKPGENSHYKKKTLE